jgi:hypothetical protein
MRQKLLFAASCLVCSVVCWRSVLRFEGTEFGSGSLAGDEGVGAFVFIVAATLIHKYPRSAALSGLAATYFSLPLFLYLVFPRPFRQVLLAIGQTHDYHEKVSVGTGGGLQEFSLHWLLRTSAVGSSSVALWPATRSQANRRYTALPKMTARRSPSAVLIFPPPALTAQVAAHPSSLPTRKQRTSEGREALPPLK